MATKQVAQTEQKTAPTTAQSGSRPIIKVSVLGNFYGVVFENAREREDGTTYTVKTARVYRRYKDNNGNWQDAKADRIEDLPKVALVANMLYQQCMVLGIDVHGVSILPTAEATDA